MEGRDWYVFLTRVGVKVEFGFDDSGGGCYALPYGRASDGGDAIVWGCGRLRGETLKLLILGPSLRWDDNHSLR